MNQRVQSRLHFKGYEGINNDRNLSIEKANLCPQNNHELQFSFIADH